MNLNLFDFDGGTRRNKNQEAMFRSLNSRQEFLHNLELERQARQSDKKKEEATIVLQKHWRRVLTQRRLRIEARKAFDALPSSSSTPDITKQKIGHIYACYEPRVDDDRLVKLCTSILGAKNTDLKEVIPLVPRQQLVKAIIRYLEHADQNINVAAPLRLLNAALDSYVISFVLIKSAFFTAVLRLMQFFLPDSLTPGEFSPKISAILDELMTPVNASGENLVYVLASLITAFCTLKAARSAVVVVIPRLRQEIVSGNICARDFINAANEALKTIKKENTAIFNYTLSQIFFHPTLSAEFQLAQLNETVRVDVLWKLLSLLSAEKFVSEETNSMEIDEDLNQNAVKYATQQLLQAYANPGWLSICFIEEKEEKAECLEKICSLTHVHCPLSTLHSMASDRSFLPRIFALFNTQRVSVQLLSNSRRLEPREASLLLPTLALFATVLAISIRTLDDEQLLRDDSTFQFNRAQLTEVSRLMRNITLGLIDISFADDLHTRVRASTSMASTSSAAEPPTKSDPYTIAYEALILLLRAIQQKSQRTGFLPETFWSDHGRRNVVTSRDIIHADARAQSAGFVHRRLRGLANDNRARPSAFEFLRLLFRSATNDDSDSDSDDEAARHHLSNSDIRNLSIMRHIPFIVPFRQRLAMFDAMLQQEKSQMGYGPTEFPISRSVGVSVRRQFLYEDAFEALTGFKAPDLRHPLRVHMVNWAGMSEPGIDGGGIFREFLSELMRTAFDPERGFFAYTSDNLLYPNPAARFLYDNYSQHFYFLGKLIAKLIYEKQLAEIRFADFFLVQLLGAERAKNVDLHHMRSYDPQFWRQLSWMRTAPASEINGLDIDFTVTVNILGENKVQELVPNGANILVTKENVGEYIQQFCDFYLYKQMEHSVDAMRAGVASVLDVQLLAIFSSAELQLIVSGADVEIDVDDMRRHTVIHQGDRFAEYLDMFWRTVRAMTAEDKRLLVKFITGVSRPPLDGFKDLYPNIGIQIQSDDSNALPSSATCMNLLKLPIYSTAEILAEKLRYAIHSGAGFELA